EEEGREGGLFSILPPKSILADSASENNTASTVRAVGGGGHGRSDSLMDNGGYQSLAGAAASESHVAVAHGDGDSVFGEFSRPRGGGVRPFSPQPMPLRINPEGLITGSYEEPSLLAGRLAGLSTEESSRRNTEESVEDGGQKSSVVIHARDEDEQPWRDEGLASETESEAQADQSQRPSVSSHGSRGLERRWSVTEDVESP
ncbi:hypothetical protein NKR19_g8854, partial [Coniochaeta hoffmannii]